MSPPTEPLGYEVHCFSNGDPLPLCQRKESWSSPSQTDLEESVQ
jgi:hypothetical protein